MREDCKHFQSRTYASGEVARFCVVDLAPEAPWRCPDGCPGYERRMADVGWDLGTLVRPRVPDEPEIIEVSDDAAALLDEAEEILSRAGPQILSEVQRHRARQDRSAQARGGRLLDRIRSRLRRR